MANHAYLRLWTGDFSESTMIAEFARFLTTAPLSKSHPHFDELVVQAVDPAETPAPLELLCHGPQYDGGVAESAGHFSADLGFEHSFTGHGGLLAPGAAANPFDSSDHPIERTFRRWMSTPANRAEYHARTRENIRLLMAWLDAITRALPVKRSELWSEGEENFEARVDAILAQH